MASIAAEAGTVVRAVTLPVATVLNPDTLAEGEPRESWATLRPALAAAWRMATDLANWCVAELYLREPRPFPRDGRMPAAPAFGTGGLYAHGVRSYPAAGEWAGCMKSFGAVVRAAERRYAQQRFDLLRRGDVSLLCYRFPFPFPVHSQAVSLSHAPGGFPVMTLPLPGLGRVALRLKRAAEFGRQLAMFRQLVDGSAKAGEAAVYRNGKGDVLVKLVGHFPRAEPSADRPHAMLVRTDPAALLVCEVDGRGPWVVNGDHLRRWQAAHRAYRQRIAEDMKREKRMDPRQRANARKSLGLRCEKHRHRMGTALHAVTAQVVRYAGRQRVGVVVFDDAVRTFIPDGFPWHELGERLRYKLDGAGVALVAADSCDPGEYAAWRGNRTAVGALALAGRRLVAGIGRAGPHPAVSTAGRPRGGRRSPGSAGR